jgi:hypothetical protein
VNGCSRSDLLAFLKITNDNINLEPPIYFGGEFFVATGEALPNICRTIERVWEANKRNFQSGRIYLKTEEHVISVALASSAYSVGKGSAMIKRMWTRPSFRNVSSGDRALLIWHLPAEKRHALQRLFYLIELDVRTLLDMSDNDFEDLVAKFIRLELSFVQKAWYLLYPIIKSIVRR